MCKNLAEKGYLSSPLIIFNRTHSRAEDLPAKIGHSVDSSIAEAVEKADIAFVCLGDDASVTDNTDTVLKRRRERQGDCELVNSASGYHSRDG